MAEQGTRVDDTTDLRWLQTAWLRRVRGRTSTYSIVTAIMLLFFGLILLFELFETDITLFEILLSATLMVVAFAVAAMVLLVGIRLPRWAGLVLVALHAAVSVYYIGLSDERQNAVASIQELPVMAMYLAWFYGSRLGRATELGILAATGSAMLLGPFGGTAVPGKVAPGLFGMANVVGLIVMCWICLEIGIFVRQRVRLDAHTDVLTGALNRRGLVHYLSEALHAAARSGRPLSVAVLDLDDFKAVNDGDGHDAGDVVLKTLVAQWTSMSRQGDLVARLGGDEFVMLLPGTGREGAAAVLQRMRQQAVHPWSWGVVEARQGEALESVLRRADAEMYRHKRGF